MSTISADALPTTRSAALPTAHARVRLHSIDALRGLVIVLMALDHVRDYFTAARFDPLDLTQTDPALFMTRWITHLCAPVFIFLAGVSAFLMSRRMEIGDLRRFLFTRGAWLIVLEVTVVNFAWNFNFRYEAGLALQVIWAIGVSMIVLGAMARLPISVIGAIGVLLVVGHNSLDGVAAESFGSWSWLWMVLHGQGSIGSVFIFYPLIPWIGVMALGFWAGQIFEMAPWRRQWILVASGLLCLFAFVALRAANVYGDPDPWTSQPNALLTFLSFIKVHKYPPSLLYLLATLGIGALLLAALENMSGRMMDLLRTFGRVPLFFYVTHFALAHLLAGVLALMLGFGTDVLTRIFLFLPDGWGFGLIGVYTAWIVVLVLLYPACRWFGRLKQRRTDWWLSYL